MTSLALAFIAGLLTLLSPCVLPLLPVVLGAAASQHRLGPLVLAAGLTLSFTVLGLFIALFGFALDIDADFFRKAAAVLLVVIGLVLMVPMAQMRLATAAGPVSNWAETRFGGFSTSGLAGQFGVGLLLGAVWSPCVGPTLGAASILAARGENLGMVALTMIVFGIGAGLPLALLGFASRQSLLAWRDRLRGSSGIFKLVFGLVLIAAGLAVLTGTDKRLETFLVNVSPQWLTDLTTQF